MSLITVKPKNVDEYIAAFSPEIQERLNTIRKIIKEMAPEATESISYGMPGYKLNNKALVYFAGFEKHTGLYALPSANEKFREELSKYKQGKGSLQFPHNKPLPVKLIEDIVNFRICENQLFKKNK